MHQQWNGKTGIPVNWRVPIVIKTVFEWNISWRSQKKQFGTPIEWFVAVRPRSSVGPIATRSGFLDGPSLMDGRSGSSSWWLGGLFEPWAHIRLRRMEIATDGAAGGGGGGSLEPVRGLDACATGRHWPQLMTVDEQVAAAQTRRFWPKCTVETRSRERDRETRVGDDGVDVRHFFQTNVFISDTLLVGALLDSRQANYTDLFGASSDVVVGAVVVDCTLVCVCVRAADANERRATESLGAWRAGWAVTSRQRVSHQINPTEPSAEP